MIKRIACAALVAAALPAMGAPAEPVPADSLDEAVAVFVASNIKGAVSNALADIASMGVGCDTARVRTLIAAELVRPYDAAAHERAKNYIERAMDAHAVEASKAMLDSAAARSGAQVLPDGLVIETLTEGSGATPSGESVVRIRYTGMLPDGTVIDTISPFEEPLTARAVDLTPGMAEGLMYMRAGGKYRLTMPAELGYGAEGVPGVIPPGCALQFDVDLIDFK